MTKPYTPRPNTLAAKVIERLQRTGGTITPAEVVTEYNVARNCVGGSLAAPLKYGALVLLNAGTRQVCYGLGTGQPDTGTPKPRRSSGKKKSKRAPRAERTTEEAAEEAPAEDNFSAARWMDGDITLHGAAVSDDDIVVLNRSQASRLLGFLQTQLAEA